MVAVGVPAALSVAGQVFQQRDHDYSGGVKRVAGRSGGERLRQRPQDAEGVLDSGGEENDVWSQAHQPSTSDPGGESGRIQNRFFQRYEARDRLLEVFDALA